MQRGKKSTGFKIGHVKSNKVNSNKKYGFQIRMVKILWVPSTAQIHPAPGARLFVVPNNGKYAYCVVRVSLGKLRLY